MQPLSLRQCLFVVCATLCLGLLPLHAADDYKLGPDSQFHPDVPHGKVEKHSFTNSAIFPGTVRDYWVYVPAQYNAAKPACLMVFQDGGGYHATNGQWRVPVVFDNLIGSHEMPVTIAVMVNPGVVPALSTNALPRYNRSLEYDGLGDSYVRFLQEELLPVVAQKYNFSTNANDRAIAGSSSGAIAAFTAAWERPDAFSRVFTTVGTFVGLRNGNTYPNLVRKVEPKPIRIFLQDGSNDNNIYGGSWWVANQDMLSSFEFSGYEVNHAWGDGSHNGKHGSSIFPDVLRWLWKDWPAPVTKGIGSKQPVMQVLIPGEEWQVVSSGHKYTEGPAANVKGEVFFTDIPNNRIHKIGLDGKVTVFAENTGGANGLMFGPDGRLYAAQTKAKRLVAYDETGKETTIAEGIAGNDLAIAHNGNIYLTESPAKKVWLIKPDGKKQVVDEGIEFPNGALLTPDQSLLIVADTKGQFAYSFQISADGTLAYKQRYFHLHIADGMTGSVADGMTVDTQGRLYIATHLGVQILDQAGRVNGIISKPQDKRFSNVCFGGANFDELYATCSDKVYKRKTQAKGVLSFQTPIKPPAPHL